MAQFGLKNDKEKLRDKDYLNLLDVLGSCQIIKNNSVL